MLRKRAKTPHNSADSHAPTTPRAWRSRRGFILSPAELGSPATGRVGRGTAAGNPATVAELPARRRFFWRPLSDHSLGLAVVLVVVALAAVVLAGCASSTRASGPAARAAHETRVERPGETWSRRVEMRVRDGGDQRDSETATEGQEAPGDATDGDLGGAFGAESAAESAAAGAGSAGASARCGGLAARSDGGAPMPVAAWLVAAAAGQTGSQSARPETTAELDALLRSAADLARERGVEVELVIDETGFVPLTADTTRSDFAEQPATLATDSADAAVGFTTRLRRFPLPWGGEARGGGFGFEATLLGGRGVNVLHIVGAAVMVLAVIPLLRTPRRWSSAAVFAGVGLAVVMTGTLVDEYPWVTLIAAVLLLGLLGYGAVEAWRRGRAHTALDAITPVVQKAGNADELKAKIGDRAGRLLAAVKAETTASKARSPS